MDAAFTLAVGLWWAASQVELAGRGVLRSLDLTECPKLSENSRSQLMALLSEQEGAVVVRI